MSITTRSPRVIDFASKATAPDVGPGSYDMPEIITTPYESPFPFNSTTAREKGDDNHNPGPAYYSPHVPRLAIHGGVSAFDSKSKRKTWDISENPGPADYGKVNNWSNQSPSHRPEMSSKTPRDNNILNPQFHLTSAADFDTRKPYNRGVSISNSARNAKPSFATPGPGEYNIQKERTFAATNSAVFLNHDDRDIFKHPDWIADYDGISQQAWKTPRAGAPFGSRKKRAPFWQKNYNPSPCQYNVTCSKTFSNYHVPFMTGSEREGIFNGDENPGPADYKLEHKRRFKESPAPFMHGSDRFPKRKEEYSACVAQYEVDTSDKVRESKLFEKPSAAFLASNNRDFFNSKEKTPGVGSYTIENSMRSHRLRHSLDCPERMKPNMIFGCPIQQTPGPDKYSDISDKEIHGAYMAREGRRIPAMPEPEKTPGPDVYAAQSSLFKPSYNVTYSTGKL